MREGKARDWRGRKRENDKRGREGIRGRCRERGSKKENNKRGREGIRGKGREE